MKTALLFSVSVLILVILLPSCTGSFRLEKRHYRNGFYFGTSGQRAYVNQDSFPTDTAANTEEPRTGGVSVESAALIAPDTTERTDTATRAAAVEEKKMQPAQPGTPQQNTAEDFPEQSPPDVPEEARGLNTMWWIALVSLVVGVFAAIIAFVPAASAVFAVLIGAAPFLIVGALVLSLIVMVSAKRRMQSSGSAELSSYYDELRKRAKWVALITAGAILVFLLFLLMVIVALSNFQ